MVRNTKQNILHRMSVSVTNKSSIVPKAASLRAARCARSAKNVPDTPMSYPHLMREYLTTFLS